MKESGKIRYEEMQCKDVILFKQKKHKLACKYNVVNFANASSLVHLKS